MTDDVNIKVSIPTKDWYKSKTLWALGISEIFIIVFTIHGNISLADSGILTACNIVAGYGRLFSATKID